MPLIIIGTTRRRAAKTQAETTVHGRNDSPREEGVNGQHGPLDNKREKSGKGRATSAVVKGTAGRKTGGRRTASSNSEEVRALTRSTGSWQTPPLLPEEEDSLSDLAEVKEEKVAIPIASE